VAMRWAATVIVVLGLLAAGCTQGVEEAATVAPSTTITLATTTTGAGTTMTTSTSTTRPASTAGLPAPSLQIVREIGSHRIIRVDAEYADPNISIFLDGRAYHAFSVEKIADDLAVRNELEKKPRLVLEFSFDDVMQHFDQVAGIIDAALGGETVPLEGNPDDLPEVRITALDPNTKVGRVAVDPEDWVSSKAKWEAALNSCNRLRLAGWRLERSPV
jgi:hypothetical protein